MEFLATSSGHSGTWVTDDVGRRFLAKIPYYIGVHDEPTDISHAL